MKFDGMRGCKCIYEVLKTLTIITYLKITFLIFIHISYFIFVIFIIFRGHNVLDNKTELQKAMEKRSFKAKNKERQLSEESEKTPFQKMLEERAKRLEQVD